VVDIKNLAMPTLRGMGEPTATQILVEIRPPPELREIV
jgi:hypothetical protein